MFYDKTLRDRAHDRLADECHGYDLDGNPIERAQDAQEAAATPEQLAAADFEPWTSPATEEATERRYQDLGPLLRVAAVLTTKTKAELMEIIAGMGPDGEEALNQELAAVQSNLAALAEMVECARTRQLIALAAAAEKASA